MGRYRMRLAITFKDVLSNVSIVTHDHSLGWAKSGPKSGCNWVG